MKTIQRSLILSLIPLLTPLAALAQSDKEARVVATNTTTTQANKGNPDTWRASQVIGVNVKNANNDTIGEVEDLVLDIRNGEILAAVVSSGGFLGMGDNLSAVPVSSLHYDKNDKAFKTKLTKDQLVKAPNFKADAWPDYSQASSVEAMRSYQLSLGGDVNDVDNTAQNKKEVNKGAATPIDQGNGEADLQITKNIRQSIMDSDLSFNAKNIKIITSNESVILKGVVQSESEHQAILNIAKNHANTAKITDELKVNSK